MRVYVSVSGSAGRQQQNSSASFKKIVTFHERLYLNLLCMVLATASSMRWRASSTLDGSEGGIGRIPERLQPG